MNLKVNLKLCWNWYRLYLIICLFSIYLEHIFQVSSAAYKLPYLLVTTVFYYLCFSMLHLYYIFMNNKKPRKVWKKPLNASDASFFSCVVPDFAWSFYNRNLDVNHKAWKIKRNYLERNQALKRNKKSASLSLANYETSNTVYIYTLHQQAIFKCIIDIAIA